MIVLRYRLSAAGRQTVSAIRRTFATKLLQGGMDIRSVQLLMGYSDLASTMRYLTPATSESMHQQINRIVNSMRAKSKAAKVNR
jgi:site-specific recombinase XerD